jgi:uncharacterized RDD family membrane protein YckC
VSAEGVPSLPREARPYQGHPAGVVTRTIAAGIDALVVAGVLVLGYTVVAGVRLVVAPLSFRPPDPSWWFTVTSACVVLVLYLGASWAATGRSYGDHVMGLRVVGSRGGRLGPVRSLVRALACTAVPVGLLWCAVSSENRSLQDIVLRTRVVYDWRPRAVTSRA